MEIKKRIFSKKNIRKRDESDSEEDKPVLQATAQPQTKKKSLNSTSSIRVKEERLLGIPFASSGTAQTLVQNNSTRTLDVDMKETEVLAGEQAEALDGLNNNTYSGLKNYKEYINKKDTNPSQQTSAIRVGPLRNTSYVRISSRFDYAPDVCKDYKDSGKAVL